MIAATVDAYCGYVYSCRMHDAQSVRHCDDIHICVRPLHVARSTGMGNAKASSSGTGNSTALTLFLFITNIIRRGGGPEA